MKRVKIHADGYNEIIFKPSTKKVVVGINVSSWNGSKYKSFKSKNEDESMRIGIEYINKHSRVKINPK